MCDQATLGLIQEVVSSAINKDELFTVFDISLAVQKLAKSRGIPTERHRHMKNEVHRELQQYIDNGLFDRQLADVGAPSKAFVYFPIGSDPSSYTPLKRHDSQMASGASPLPSSVDPAIDAAQSTIAVPQVAPVATSVAQDDDDEGDEVETDRQPDSRGTVTVPSYLLRASGLKPGDKAHVKKDSNGNGSEYLVISADPNGSLAVYTVDKYNNVRITKPRLENIGANTTYDFILESDRVIIKTHV